VNILHNLDNSNLGGIQELIFLLYKFSRHRHDFWAADGSMAPILREAGMQLWPGGPPADIHYDVIVGHGVGGWSYNDVARWSGDRGAKFVEVMHSICRSQTDPAVVNGFIALSHLAADCNRHMPNLTTIYGMVDDRLFSAREPKLIGRMSRLVQEKRPWEFAKLAQRFPHEQFILGGDGPERSRISTGDNLFLVGTVRDFGAFYGQLKLFLYPTQDECCCMSVAMAQTAGVPVICQDLPALRETTGGLATFCHSAKDFENAVLDYLERPEPYERKADQARSWAWANFGRSVVSGRWDDYLEVLCQ
jgi:hypothetical protein